MVLTNNLLIYWLCNSLKVFDLIVSFDWYFIDLQSLWKIVSFSPEWLVFQKKKKKIVLIVLIYKLYENLIWIIFLNKFNSRCPKSSQTSHTVCLKNVFCTRDNLKINKNVWYFCQRDCTKLFLMNHNNMVYKVKHTIFLIL